MRKPIPFDPQFLATLLSREMMRQGVTELSCTQEEFFSLNMQDYELSLDGEFEADDDESPTSFRVVLELK